MSKPKIYADFNNLDDSNRLRLTCAGTIDDLARQCIELREGLALTFYMDDADDDGEPDELRTDGVVHYDDNDRSWVASVDWSNIRHESDERGLGPGGGEPSIQAIAVDNGPTSQGAGPLSPAAKLSR